MPVVRATWPHSNPDILQNVPVQQRVTNMTKIVQRIRQTGAAIIPIDLGSEFLDAFNGALPGINSQTSSTLVPECSKASPERAVSCSMPSIQTMPVTRLLRTASSRRSGQRSAPGS